MICVMREVIDVEYEVVSERTPVHWQPVRRKPPMPWFKKFYAALIMIVAGYTLLLGLGGADLDTTDAVAAAEARQPVAAKFP